MRKGDPARPSRRSLRLSGYDYSQPGAYFVTSVTFQREHLFGEIQSGEMILNDAGRIVWEIWQSLPGRYPGIFLGKAIIMPNHFHGIVIIKEKPVNIENCENSVAAIHELPLRNNESKEIHRLARRKMLLPRIIGYFKMNSARRINLLLDSASVPVWQRNYYERVLRTDPEFHAITHYIEANPSNWDSDEENR